MRAATRTWIFAIALALLCMTPATLAQAPSGELFPQPFIAWHQTVHMEDDGTRYVSDPVKSTYGGSWWVSERSDGSRLVLDLARREITEIRPEAGTYWRIGFSRLAELQTRMERLDEMPSPDGVSELEGVADEAAKSQAPNEQAPEQPRLRARELATPPVKGLNSSLEGAPITLDGGADVRFFRIELESEKSAGAAPAAEVWVDPSIRLSARAQDALAAFERDALRSNRHLDGQASPLELMKVARSQAGGAYPVRVSRPIPGGLVEDVTTRLEPIDSFELDLVRVPDGLERIAHPLETALVFMEKEAERRRMMGSLPQ